MCLYFLLLFPLLPFVSSSFYSSLSVLLSLFSSILASLLLSSSPLFFSILSSRFSPLALFSFHFLPFFLSSPLLSCIFRCQHVISCFCRLFSDTSLGTFSSFLLLVFMFVCMYASVCYGRLRDMRKIYIQPSEISEIGFFFCCCSYKSTFRLRHREVSQFNKMFGKSKSTSMLFLYKKISPRVISVFSDISEVKLMHSSVLDWNFKSSATGCTGLILYMLSH